MRELSGRLLEVLYRALDLKVSNTGAKCYLPCAGPPCFLERGQSHNDIFRFNGDTIFPSWEDFACAAMFDERHPDTEVLRMLPGDGVVIGGSVLSCADPRPESATWLRPSLERLELYSELRRSEWEHLNKTQSRAVTTEDLSRYFEQLHRRNRVLIQTARWKKRLIIEIENSSARWRCLLGEGGPSVEEASDTTGSRSPADREHDENGEYTFSLPEWMLRDIIDGQLTWEQAFLSLRVFLSRTPDVYDVSFMVSLRYGNQQEVTKALARHLEIQRGEQEMIELEALPGVKIQRYCPHQGADLTDAVVTGDIITCPLHGWVFSTKTGECLQGGNCSLRIESLDW